VKGDPTVGSLVYENSDISGSRPACVLKEQLHNEAMGFECLSHSVPADHVLEADEVGGQSGYQVRIEGKDRERCKAGVLPNAVGTDTSEMVVDGGEARIVERSVLELLRSCEELLDWEVGFGRDCQGGHDLL
jgi:hypothetical protein